MQFHHQRFRTFSANAVLVLVALYACGCSSLTFPEQRKSPEQKEPMVLEETFKASFDEVWYAVREHLEENFTIHTADKSRGLIATQSFTGAAWEKEFRECSRQPHSIDLGLIFATASIVDEDDWVFVRLVTSDLNSLLYKQKMDSRYRDANWLRCLREVPLRIWSATRVRELINEQRIRGEVIKP